MCECFVCFFFFFFLIFQFLIFIFPLRLLLYQRSPLLVPLPRPLLPPVQIFNLLPVPLWELKGRYHNLFLDHITSFPLFSFILNEKIITPFFRIQVPPLAETMLPKKTSTTASPSEESGITLFSLSRKQ